MASADAPTAGGEAEMCAAEVFSLSGDRRLPGGNEATEEATEALRDRWLETDETDAEP